MARASFRPNFGLATPVAKHQRVSFFSDMEWWWIMRMFANCSGCFTLDLVSDFNIWCLWLALCTRISCILLPRKTFPCAISVRLPAPAMALCCWQVPAFQSQRRVLQLVDGTHGPSIVLWNSSGFGSPFGSSCQLGHTTYYYRRTHVTFSADGQILFYKLVLVWSHIV